MTFINAIVNSPEDLEFRVSLRYEFMDLGIDDCIPELRELKNDVLNTHLNVFEDEAVADAEEVSEAHGLPEIDIKDPDDIISAIKNNITDAESFTWWLRSLQHLLLMPTDAKRRQEFFYLAILKS